MNPTQKADRVGLYRRICRNRGERLTVQRRVILEAVLDLDNHPSADQVFEAVRDQLSDIARPTVYRTLEHLARMGVITKACHPGRVTRYDARIDVHHHLVCLRCNEIADFESPHLDALEIPDTSGCGFEVSDHRVQLRGICRTCRDADRKGQST
jgi:Fur family peroxide stress response transcriptional regulator